MPFDPQFDDFITSDTVKLYDAATGGKAIKFGLWGDGIRTVADDGGARVKVRLRGAIGWVARSALGGTSLLEYYFIDVGQGDGVLIKTPDWRHLLIDGGYPRSSQPTGKSAADFVDWKFAKDYGTRTIALDAMISSHIDADHYGGLDDLLDPAQNAELDCTAITIEAFYHSGLAHWAEHGTEPAGLGPYVAHAGRTWFTRVLGDRASAEAAIGGGTGPQLRGWWADFIRHLTAARTAAGTPTPIVRLDQHSGWLPGFAQGAPLAIRVLGPLAEVVDGAPALMRLAADQGQNTNGTSVLLRLDHGKTRTLMTGDLNQKAHHALLAEYAGREGELAVDIAKSCHHGADDVSLAFLKALEPGCTVISSGDAEGHDHPRPRIVAASGLTGHFKAKGDEIVTPLVYSTELARSVSVGIVTAVVERAEDGDVVHDGAALGRVDARYSVTSPGGLRATRKQKPMAGMKVMDRLIYGLVNVRTDGTRILCATMNEGDGSFSAKSFDSRF